MKKSDEKADVLLPVWCVRDKSGAEVSVSADTADAAILASAPALGLTTTRSRVAPGTVRAIKAELVVGGYEMESVAKSDIPDLMHESSFARRTTSFVNPAAFKISVTATSAVVRPSLDLLMSKPGVVGRPKYEILLTVVAKGDPDKIKNWLQSTREKLATKTSVGR